MAVGGFTTVVLPAFAITVSVDGDGRPQIVVEFPIKDFPISAIVTFEFRHFVHR